MRALNYRYVNPDANTFIYAFKSLILSNLLSPHSKYANCEVDNGDTLIDANFLFEDNVNENVSAHSIPSTSQESKCLSNISGSITKDDVILEKVKVQCSVYTAGFICRKIKININVRAA